MRLSLCFFLSSYILMTVLYSYTKVTGVLPPETQENLTVYVFVLSMGFANLLFYMTNTDKKEVQDNHDNKH